MKKNVINYDKLKNLSVELAFGASQIPSSKNSARKLTGPTSRIVSRTNSYDSVTSMSNEGEKVASVMNSIKNKNLMNIEENTRLCDILAEEFEIEKLNSVPVENKDKNGRRYSIKTRLRKQ